MIQIFKEELGYIKSLPKSEFIKKSKEKRWIKLAIVLLIWIPLDIVLGFGSWELVAWSFPILEEADMDIMENGLAFAVFSAILFAPLAEESMFRLFLKFSRARWNISFLLFGLAAFIISKYLAFTLLILWVIIGIWFYHRYFYSKFLFRFLKYKKFWFWLMVLLFGFTHISNFDLEIVPIYLYPLAVLPQLFGGLILGIVRLRFGFWFAVFLHAFNNAVALLYIYFTS